MFATITKIGAVMSILPRHVKADVICS